MIKDIYEDIKPMKRARCYFLKRTRNEKQSLKS